MWIQFSHELMSSERTTENVSTFRVLPAFAMLVGAALVLLGVVFLLGGTLYGWLHISAIGVSIFLAGMVSTRWAADRWNMSPKDQRNWAVAFTSLTGILLILFIIINSATFEEVVIE